MLGRRQRNLLPLLMLIIAFSCAEDSNIEINSATTEQNEAANLKLQLKSEVATTVLPTEADNLSSSTLKPEVTTAATTNGVSFIATRVQTQNAAESEAAVQQEPQQQTPLPPVPTNSQTGRFKGGGGTVQLVINTPATRYPPHYHTTPYPYPPTRPPHHHYPPPYPYPPYPYPPYPTQAPTTSRPNWPPYWPPYGGGFPGGGFPGGGFPGYGFGYGYPGYGYPWYHHHHHHWNNTDGQRSASIDIVSSNQANLSLDEEEIEKKQPAQGAKSAPFFSFLNFNRS